MNKIVKVATASVVGLISAAVLAGYTGVGSPKVNAAVITQSELHTGSSINSYIANNKIQPVGITKELHTFQMFKYNTSGNKPVGVVFHYTDNASNYSARNEANYEINGGWKNAFVHTFIDAGTILNIHDTNYGCWGSGPQGNKRFVQFELVTARSRNDFAHSISNAAWYVAYLAHEYGWNLTLASQHNGSGTLWTHYDVTHYLGGTDHTDPIAYLNSWGYNTSQFLDLAKAYFDYGGFYDTITSNVAKTYNATISENNRNDGLYATGPYYTSDQTRVPATVSAKTLNGQSVKVLRQAVTKRATWVQIQTSSGAVWWMDKRGITVDYDKVLSSRTVSYSAYLDQSYRNDGLYKDGPYMTGPSTFEFAAKHASQYDKQPVSVLAEETTSRGTWVKIRLSNGDTWWMDKAGIKTYDSISGEKSLGNVTVRVTQDKRNDGLYASGPYHTSAQTILPAAKTLKKYNGQTATAIREEKTPLATWVQIKLEDGSTWWFDERGITFFDSILSKNDNTSTVIVRQDNRNDGLYASGPYMTNNSTFVPAWKTAKKYNGQRATVLGEETTKRATWVHIKFADGSTWWMDKRGVAPFSFDKVLSTSNVSYNAQIIQNSRNDGLYHDGPYMTGETTYATASKTAKPYNGQAATVLKEETTVKATWVQVKLQNGSTWWMDKRGILAFDPISNRVNVNYKVLINQSSRTDGLYATGPYYTSLATKLAAVKTAKQFNGQEATVTVEATTPRATWVLVKFANGSSWWMDKRGVTPQQ
ncbi:GW dipeptide domain-containing protein [Lacticaseibacillus thailandensis]|nr:GW dipeptide domain-containing protein [Lacticaseibacillus thailandensis]